jgi:hypothetical protein
VLNSYRLHANGYVTKPVTADTFIEVIRQIEHFFGSVAPAALAATVDGIGTALRVASRAMRAATVQLVLPETGACSVGGPSGARAAAELVSAGSSACCA